MKILLAGGGSGGHVTPLKAIAEELDPKLHQIYVTTDRKFYDQTCFLFRDLKSIKINKIFAGKYRRYQGKSIAWHILHLPTFLRNIRDIFYLLVGILQAILLMARLKPDVVFCKGGFVCIPIGVAGRVFKKKLIIHDSDTRPGLTNKLLSKWATKIATGMPGEFYPYPKSKMIHVGMPVDAKYGEVSQLVKEKYKSDLGFSKNQPVLLVTGGGNGAEQINSLISEIAPSLLNLGWGIEHIAGTGKSKALLDVRQNLSENAACWHISEFTDMLPRIMAADVVVARTSATTLQECANSKKAVIGIPSPHLSDQIMNAEYFESKNALLYLQEDDLTAQKLKQAILDLKNNKEMSESLSGGLYKSFAMPSAAKKLAKMITQ